MTRTDQASRLIKAPARRIYAALVDADARARWLPPDGMTGRFERFEPRVGGTYRMILTYTDASAAPGKSSADSDIVEARFVEFIPNRRVAEFVDFESDDPAFAGTMTMTWDLAETPDGTRVTITAEDVPDGISAEDHQLGLISSLGNLARYAEG
jgi:uncharacterized protein YndB with AHSA1/START domain